VIYTRRHRASRTALLLMSDMSGGLATKSFVKRPESRGGGRLLDYDRGVSDHLIASFISSGDSLVSNGDANAWLRANRLIPEGAALSNSEHAALLRLREALLDVLIAMKNGSEDVDASARLTRALAEGRLVVMVDSAGAITLNTAARAVYPSVVAAIAVAIARASAAGEWPTA